MADCQRYKLMGPGGVEIAELTALPVGAWIELKVLDGNIWGVLDLDLVEQVPEVEVLETPSELEEQKVEITEAGLEALTGAETSKPKRAGKKGAK